MELSDNFTMDGPAYKISTAVDDHSIVLNESTSKQINELRRSETPWRLLPGLWSMQRHFKTGRTVLFYGPPETGETEKNLHLFPPSY